MRNEVIGSFFDPTVYDVAINQGRLGENVENPHLSSAVTDYVISTASPPIGRRIYDRNDPSRQLGGAGILHDPTQGVSFNLIGMHKRKPPRIPGGGVAERLEVMVYDNGMWCDLCGDCQRNGPHRLHAEDYDSTITGIEIPQSERRREWRNFIQDDGNQTLSCRTHQKQSTLIRVDTLVNFARDMSDFERKWVPGISWGWHDMRAPYDPGKIGRNKTGTGQLTATVISIINRLATMFYASTDGRGLGGLQYFKADTSLRIDGMPSGESNLYRLFHDYGMMFEATDNIYDIDYLDSAWYIGNRLNNFLPYADHIDFVVRNANYVDPDRFLKVYMEKARNSLAPDVLCQFMTWRWTWYTDYAFKLTIKWPLVYKNANDEIYQIGYLVYEPDDILLHTGNEDALRDDDTPEGKRFWVWDAHMRGEFPFGDGSSFPQFGCQSPENYVQGFRRWSRETRGGRFIRQGNKLLGNVAMKKGSALERLKYERSTERRNNNYLTLMSVPGESLVTRSEVRYHLGESGYPVRDFRTDRVEPHDRAQGWPSDLEKQQMWEIAQLILWAEGVNMGMKGIHWVAANYHKWPWASAAATAIYEIDKRESNARAVRTGRRWLIRAWRAYKEFQDLLDLVNEAQETYKRIGKTWEGLESAYHNIHAYYRDFNWRNVRLTNISRILPFQALYGFDRATLRFQKSVVDFNQATHDLALHADSVYISPLVALSKRIYWEVQVRNTLETEMELRQIDTEMAQLQNAAGRSRDAVVSQKLSLVTGAILLRTQEVRFRTMSDGMRVVANALSTIENEAQDWKSYGDYMSNTFSQGNFDEFARQWRMANSGGMPTMAPIFAAFGNTPDIFDRNLTQRGLLHDWDFWKSPRAHNFVEVDNRLRAEVKSIGEKTVANFRKGAR